MHKWGDGFEYFEEIERAAYYIGEYCRRWGRISVTQTKEKYGTVRVYCSLGAPENLYWFFRPGWVYYRWPGWVREIDDATFGNLFKLFNKPFYYWQKKIYRRAYKNGLKKWPMIREEILNCADFSELLEGL